MSQVEFRIKTDASGEIVPEFPDECEPHVEPGYPASGDMWEVAEWAREMGKTYVQRQCKGCGLYAVWEAKPGDPA